jgi:hypothetical protein
MAPAVLERDIGLLYRCTSAGNPGLILIMIGSLRLLSSESEEKT